MRKRFEEISLQCWIELLNAFKKKQNRCRKGNIIYLRSVTLENNSRDLTQGSLDLNRVVQMAHCFYSEKIFQKHSTSHLLDSSTISTHSNDANSIGVIVLALIYGILTYRPILEDLKTGVEGLRESFSLLRDANVFKNTTSLPRDIREDNKDNLHDCPDIVQIVPLEHHFLGSLTFRTLVTHQTEFCLVNCLSVIVSLSRSFSPNHTMWLLQYIVDVVYYFSETLTLLSQNVQSQFMYHLLPWFISWACNEEGFCFLPDFDGILERTLLQILRSLESSSFLESSKTDCIYAFCFTFLNTFLIPAESCSEEVNKGSKKKTLPIFLTWLALGTIPQFTPNDALSCSPCLNCLNQQCRYLNCESIDTFNHNYTTGASLRCFFIAFLFYKALCWATVDTLTFQDISSVTRLECRKIPQQFLPLSTKKNFNQSHNLSQSSLAVREISAELVLALWMYSPTTSCRESFTPHFPLRSTICLLLGHRLVSLLAEVARVPSLQPLIQDLYSRCPLDFLRLIDRVENASLKLTEIYRDSTTGDHRGHQLKYTTCHEAHLVLWRRRHWNHSLESIAHYLLQRGVNSFEPHPETKTSSSFYASWYLVPHRVRPNLAFFLWAIPMDKELNCFMLSSSLCSHFSGFLLQSNSNALKEMFKWFAFRQHVNNTTLAEQFIWTLRILDVLLLLSRYPEACNFFSPTQPNQLQPEVSGKCLKPTARSSPMRQQKTSKKDASHIPDHEVFLSKGLGLNSCSEFCRQLLMANLFHPTGIPPPLLARLFQVVLESCCLNRLTVALYIFETQCKPFTIDKHDNARYPFNDYQLLIPKTTLQNGGTIQQKDRLIIPSALIQPFNNTAKNLGENRLKNCFSGREHDITHETAQSHPLSHNVPITSNLGETEEKKDTSLILNFMETLALFLSNLCNMSSDGRPKTEKVLKPTSRGYFLVWTLQDIIEKVCGSKCISYSKNEINNKYLSNPCQLWLWYCIGRHDTLPLSLHTRNRECINSTPATSCRLNTVHGENSQYIHLDVDGTRSFGTFKDSSGQSILHPLITCLLHSMSHYLLLWTKGIGQPLLTALCLEFLEYGLYQLQCIRLSDISKKNLLNKTTNTTVFFTEKEITILMEWLSFITCNELDSHFFPKLSQRFTPSLIAYYVSLCRKTLIGRLLIMCGIDPQLVLYHNTRFNLFRLTTTWTTKDCPARPIFDRRNLHYTLHNLNDVPKPIFPMISREIIENDMGFPDPPFLSPEFPVHDILLFVITEAFRALFFCAPLLFFGTKTL